MRVCIMLGKKERPIFQSTPNVPAALDFKRQKHRCHLHTLQDPLLFG